MLRDSADLINRRLGNYTIQHLIRETHMSAVYYGKELVTERAVAVKVLFPNIRSNDREYRKYVTRFQREAILITKLKHPYIVPILAYVEYEELACLVMPFYENGTLGELIRRRRQLPLRDTVQYFEQIAPALAYAHSQNITHRDIKPGNFLLDENGCLILTDFGIARLTGNPNWVTLTTSNRVLGTVEYMAPELFHGEKADHRTDIYALGIVIYEMLQGTVPFSGADSYAIIDQHMNDPLPLLHPFNPSIPVSVDSILKKATAKRREDRYESVSELAAALSHVIQPRTLNDAPTEIDLLLEPQFFSSQAQMWPPTVPAKPVGIPHVQRKKARSSPRNLIWAFLVAILIIILGISSFFYVYKPFTPSQSLSTPVSLTPSQQAQATVAAYYNDWNKGEYPAAYNLLNPTYQRGYTYKEAHLSYVNVLYSCVSYDGVKPLPDGTIQVSVLVNQIQVNPSAINVYKGYFIAQQVQGEWRIHPPKDGLPLQKNTHGVCVKP